MRCDASSTCPCVILTLGFGIQAHLSAKYDSQLDVLSAGLSISRHGTLYPVEVDVLTLVAKSSPEIIQVGPRSLTLCTSVLQALQSSLWTLLIPQGWIPPELRPAPVPECDVEVT